MLLDDNVPFLKDTLLVRPLIVISVSEIFAIALRLLSLSYWNESINLWVPTSLARNREIIVVVNEIKHIDATRQVNVKFLLVNFASKKCLLEHNKNFLLQSTNAFNLSTIAHHNQTAKHFFSRKKIF